MGMLNKRAGIFSGIIGLVLCWTLISGADEWDKLRIRKFDPPQDAPRVSLKSMDGKEITLADYKGKVVFLNFWTTWCGYCKREMPSMEKLYNKYKDKGFIIVAVDVRESAEKVKAFWERYDLTFPAVLDPTGMAAMAYGVRGYPASFFLDRDGKVVGGAPGAREWFDKDSQALVEKLVGEGGPENEKKSEDEKENPEGTEESNSGAESSDEAKTVDLRSISGPPVHSQGRIQVSGKQVFDLDEGVIGNDKTADLSWSEVGFSTRYLIPQNGAGFVNKGALTDVAFDDIILATYSSSPINGSEGEKNKLKPGTILYARTSDERYACLRVDGYGSVLDISWVTFEKE